MADDNSYMLVMSSEVWQAHWDESVTTTQHGPDGLSSFDTVTVPVRRRADAPRPEPPEGYGTRIRHSEPAYDTRLVQHVFSPS